MLKKRIGDVMKRVMVRADDLGYSEAVNYGIAKTVKDGIIKNIGFMVNMPYSQHGWDLVKQEDVCLGQHTNICVGKPICDPSLIPSITNANGEFKSSKEYRSAKTDFVVLEEVILEIEAQYQRFKDITGREPSYFEGHAVSSDNFFKGLEIVAQRHNLKYLGMGLGTYTMFNGQKMYMKMDSMMPDYDPFQSFQDMVEHAHEDGYDMLVFHPGYLDAFILQTSSLTIPRTQEVEMSCAEATKAWIKDHQLHLYTYDEVK